MFSSRPDCGGSAAPDNFGGSRTTNLRGSILSLDPEREEGRIRVERGHEIEIFPFDYEDLNLEEHYLENVLCGMAVDFELRETFTSRGDTAERRAVQVRIYSHHLRKIVL